MRCNNNAVLQNIPCPKECKIVGQTLVDHALSYAMTATADVPAQKKDVIQYPRFIKLMIADLIKKFPSIPQRLEEDYHSIKDDIPLMSVYTIGNVTIKGMLIPDEFLTDDICATQEYKEYEKVFVWVDVPIIQPQPVESTQGTNKTPTPVSIVNNVVQKKRKRNDDRERDEIAEATLLSLAMHKTALAAEAQENVAKDQEKLMKEDMESWLVINGLYPEDIEKMVDDEDEESYASEFADSVFLNEEDDSGTRLVPESHKENPETVDDDDDDDKEENKDDKKDDDNDDDDNDDHTHHTLVKDQELTATVSPTPATTSQDRSKTRRVSSKYKHISRALHRMCRRQADIIIQERDAFQAEVPALISKEFVDHAPKINEELFKIHMNNNVIQVQPTTSASTSTTTSVDLQQQLYLKMKSNFHNQAGDPALWDVDPQVIDEDEAIPEEETPELIDEFQNVDKRITTIYDHARMKATLNDMMSNQFRNVKEYACHLEQLMNYIKNQIVCESRQEDIKRSKPYAHVFYGPKRNPNEPPRYLYNKDLFFVKYGNTKENSYVLSIHKIHVVPFLEDDLEEKMNRWVRKEFKTFNEEAWLSIQH
ncbi:hypothetical protein Tco_1525668 [Tanacetum coccineum]